MKFSFEAIPSGDLECGCWSVTPDTFRHVNKLLHPDRPDCWEPCDSDKCPFYSGYVCLYDYYTSVKQHFRRKLVEVTVEVVEGGDTVTLTIRAKRPAPEVDLR